MSSNNKKNTFSRQVRDEQPASTTDEQITDLIARHWHMATGLASSYRNIPGVEFEDILQHARLALVKAAQKFDSSRGAVFSTFAWCSIRNELNTLYSRQKKFFGKEVSISHSMVSEDQDNAYSLLDLIGTSTSSASSILIQMELQHALRESIQALPPHLRKVIHDILEKKQYQDIGKKMGFSEASAKTLVSRAYRHALKLLRSDLSRRGFDTPHCFELPEV